MPTFCDECANAKPLTVCAGVLQVGNWPIGSGFDVFVYIYNLTTGRLEVYAVETGTDGIIEVEGFSPVADHLYQIHVNDSDNEPEAMDTFDVGGEDVVCLNVRFKRQFTTGANIATPDTMTITLA